MEQAYGRDPTLAPEAAGARVQRAIRAMRLEAEIRTSPEKRADRFVEDWRKLDRRYRAAYDEGDHQRVKRLRGDIGAMAKSLERDAQMESILRGRRHDLGIDFDVGRKLVHDFARANLNAYGVMVKAMRQSPALRFTPDEMATRLATAGKQARAEDQLPWRESARRSTGRRTV